MASWADVRRIALDLPGAVEDTAGSTTAWRVGRRAFAWERVLRRGELAGLGPTPPQQPALGLRVTDLGAQAAWLQQHPRAFFLVPPYEGSAMVLVRVEAVPHEVLDEALTEAWLSRAPQSLVRAFLAQAPPDTSTR